MTSTTNISGFSELMSLPKAQMWFFGLQVSHPIENLFYLALLEMNPRGLIVGFEKSAGMEEKQEVFVDVTSKNGTTSIVHLIEGDKYQGVGIPEDEARRHQGCEVTVIYSADINGVRQSSSPVLFTITSGNLDLTQLPEAKVPEVKNGVLRLSSIEPDGASIEIPPIPGLHRGTYLTVVFSGGGVNVSVARFIPSTADVALSLLMPFHKVAALLGQEVTLRYAIHLLPDVHYNVTNSKTFTVER